MDPVSAAPHLNLRRAGGQGREPSPYQRAVAECSSLACLRDAARQPRYRGQYLFPHFLIIGWQKCATTSL